MTNFATYVNVIYLNCMLPHKKIEVVNKLRKEVSKACSYMYTVLVKNLYLDKSSDINSP